MSLLNSFIPITSLFEKGRLEKFKLPRLFRKNIILPINLLVILFIFLFAQFHFLAKKNHKKA